MPDKQAKKIVSLPPLGILLAIVFWLFDSALDIYVFQESETFIEALFFSEPMELWMRSIVSILIISFAFYAQYLLQKQYLITQQLQDVNNRLEKEAALRIEVEKQLEHQANHDALTGLYNRRKFDEILAYEIYRARRYKSELTLVFCDLDYFKNINDNHGHEMGDTILKLFSDKLKESVRETDVVARWGGEEFVILLLNTVSKQSERMADAIRETIECSEFQSVGQVTVSMGVSHFLEVDTKQSLFDRADKALHLAKENGRNRVEVVIG